MGVCTQFGSTDVEPIDATRYYYLLQGGEDAFNALFILYFCLFDATFTEMQATYMDSNAVFAATEDKLLGILTSSVVASAPTRSEGKAEPSARKLLHLHFKHLEHT